MSGTVNKIPLQVFHLRSYKGCDENVTLLQACYDNPVFQQEEAKFNLDGTLEKKPRSKDYAPADEIPEIKFQEKEATKKRKLYICIIGFIVCCVAVVGFLVGYLISSAQSMFKPFFFFISMFIIIDLIYFQFIMTNFHVQILKYGIIPPSKKKKRIEQKIYEV
jgi:hypothetical protein